MNWQQLRDQTTALWSSLAPSQRATLGFVALVMVFGFSFLMMRPTSSGRVPISAGKSFTVEEAMHAEHVLLAAGLEDFELRGGQLLVPRGEAERYNAALIAGGGLPQNWAEEWEAQMNNLGQFAGSRQRADVVEISRAKMVSQYLSQLPDISVANVVWDEDKQPGFRAAAKTRATVFLRPTPGREITTEVVSAVRMAVANAKKHLAPENVVIMDVTGQRTYDGSGGGEFNDKTLMRIHKLTEMYEQKAYDLLSYIPGVRITANVNLERLKESLVRKQQINPKESFAVVENGSTNKDKTQRTTVSGEPGSAPNVGLDLQNGRGPVQSRDLNQTTTQNISTASFEITESALAGGLPESVTMSVSIPKSYYRTVALTQSEIRNNENVTEDEIDAVAQQVEQQVLSDVKTKVEQILPPGPSPTEDPNFRSVVVDSITVPETVDEDVGIPFSVTAMQLAQTYARPLALTVLAVIALVMLNKSLSRPMPELPTLTLPQPSGVQLDEDGNHIEEPNEDDLPDLFTPPENKKREHLQDVVREKPELAAAVVARWVSEGR